MCCPSLMVFFVAIEQRYLTQTKMSGSAKRTRAQRSQRSQRSKRRGSRRVRRPRRHQPSDLDRFYVGEPNELDSLAPAWVALGIGEDVPFTWRNIQRPTQHDIEKDIIKQYGLTRKAIVQKEPEKHADKK